MSTVSILSTSSLLWRSWAGQRITRGQWIGDTGSFICSWIQGLIVKWRMILLVRQRFKIFPSEEYMAHFSHRRSGGNSKLRSKVGRNPERQRRLVWFLTRSITWARVIYIFYRSPECSIRTALFFFRGATRISLGYSNWSDWEECSVLLAFGAGAMVATTHPHHRLPILHGKGEIHVDLLCWMRVSLRYLGISPSYHTATNTNNLWLRSDCFFVLFLELLFLRRQSDCSNQPTARVVGAQVWLFVWHTVSYGYDWRECCQHRVSKRFPICC